MRTLLLSCGVAAVIGVAPASGAAQATVDLPTLLPQAVVDLRTAEGAALVGARWRYSDVRIVETEHRDPGPDLRPSGAPNRTTDIVPHAGAADFDDSAWPVIEPAELETRRTHGRLAFNWYRTRITLPARIGEFDARGSTVVLELVLDDYAEIWVDGKLPLVLGQTGGQLVKGFNAPNRVVLTHDARAGQQIQLAIFGANGPLSKPPANFIWVRSATLELHRCDVAPRRTRHGLPWANITVAMILLAVVGVTLPTASSPGRTDEVARIAAPPPRLPIGQRLAAEDFAGHGHGRVDGLTTPVQS